MGFEAATLSEIAREADIAVGTLYTRFRDKDALLGALHEAATERSRRLIAERLGGDRFGDRSLRRILEEMIRNSLELARSMAGFQRAAYQRALTDPAFVASRFRIVGVRTPV